MNSNNQQLSKPLSTTKWAKYQRAYRNKNKETCSKCEANYRSTPEAKIKSAARCKKWKELNKQKNAEYQKQYREKNKEPLQQYIKKYRAQNEKKPKAPKAPKDPKKKFKSSAATQAYKRWAAKNKNKINENHKKWKDTQIKINPMFNIIQKLRGAVLQAFKRIRQNKPADTQPLLGCTWEEAKAHFESPFREGMNWSNHGEWHIDHIRPVSLFTKEDMHLMNHISNLQPLWAAENLTKGNSYDK